MAEHPSPRPSATSGPPEFDERLSVPWWWYVLAIGLAGLLGAEVHLGHPGVRSWIGYAVTVPVLVGLLVWLGRVRVRVADGELQVGPPSARATLPLRHVGRVEVVGPADKQVALGPDLDPAARIVHRPWVGPLVRVEVTGPAEDTARPPYWIFSVRDPHRLVAALRAAAA